MFGDYRGVVLDRSGGGGRGPGGGGPGELGVERALGGVVPNHTPTDSRAAHSRHPYVAVTGRVVVQGDSVLTLGVFDLIGHKEEGGIEEDNAYPVLWNASLPDNIDIKDFVVRVVGNEKLGNLMKGLKGGAQGGVEVLYEDACRGNVG